MTTERQTRPRETEGRCCHEASPALRDRCRSDALRFEHDGHAHRPNRRVDYGGLRSGPGIYLVVAAPTLVARPGRTAVNSRAEPPTGRPCPRTPYVRRGCYSLSKCLRTGLRGARADRAGSCRKSLTGTSRSTDQPANPHPTGQWPVTQRSSAAIATDRSVKSDRRPTVPETVISYTGRAAARAKRNRLRGGLPSPALPGSGPWGSPSSF